MISFVNKTLQNQNSFDASAQELFREQYHHNKIYKRWCDSFYADIRNISSINQIPFLPISFFKTSKVITGNENYELIFESSGTTQATKSSHFIKDLNVYKESFTVCFQLFYGDVKDWCIIGLLPSYLQQKNSSLVKMADGLIELSGNENSGFYLDEYKKLAAVLQANETAKQKTLLIGVTYALLDFAEQNPLLLSNTIIMETGGMKGRRKELTRIEVHAILKYHFGLEQIHSEYGMTELLSQAYAKADGKFYCPPWMKVFVRDEDDPLLIKKTGKGALNIVDLANLHSCAFIATEDAGEVFEDGSFEVTGRLDNSDIRGCSLMVL